MSRPRVHIKRANWIVPRGYAAITLGNWIFVRHSARITAAFLAHELTHVLQWRRLGVWGFLWNYGWTFARDGFRYRNIDLEEEARKPTPDTYAWARDLLEGMDR